jgi:DNA excision repair protein ERCC-4
MCTLLEYENQLYLDLFHNDALVVMAEGLGIERIFMNFIKVYCNPSQLVLIINTDDAEEDYFLKQLEALKSTNDLLPKKITNETHSVTERTQEYLNGGCLFVTSRILVVDMLTDRVPMDLITGILVYKAHQIIDSCQETFLLRMFRQKNKVKLAPLRNELSIFI